MPSRPLFTLELSLLIQLWKLFSRFASGLFGNKWTKVKGGKGESRAGSSEGFLIYLFGALLLFYSVSHHHVNNFPPESLNYSLEAALFACGEQKQV